MLIYFFTIFIGSFCAKNIVVKTISNELTKKYVSGYILDEMIGKYDTDTILEFSRKVNSNKQIDSITNKFLDVVIFNLENDCYKNIHIDYELNIIMKDVLTDVSSTSQKYIELSVQRDNFQEIVNKITDSINNSFNNLRLFVIFYGIVTSIKFRMILLVLIITTLINIAMINNSRIKTIIHIGIDILFASGIVGILAVIVKLLTNLLRQRVFGGRISGVYLHGTIRIDIVLFGLGIIVTVIGIIFKEKNDKE